MTLTYALAVTFSESQYLDGKHVRDKQAQVSKALDCFRKIYLYHC